MLLPGPFRATVNFDNSVSIGLISKPLQVDAVKYPLLVCQMLCRYLSSYLRVQQSTAEGMHPDPKKVQGITEMTPPLDKQQLQHGKLHGDIHTKPFTSHGAAESNA